MFKENFHEKTTLILSLLIMNNYFLLSVGLSNLILKINLIFFFFFIFFYYLKNFKENIFLKIFFILFILISIGTPAVEWDPRSIWLFQAKRIFFDNSIYSIADNYFNIHYDYPSLAPSLASTFAMTFGIWNEVLPKLAFLFMFLPPLILLYVFFHNTSYIIFLYIVFFFIGKYLFTGWMDGLVAMYFSISSFLMYIIVIKDNSIYKNNYLLSSIAFVFFTILTLLKNEGFVLLLLLFFTTAILQLSKNQLKENFFKLFIFSLSFLPIIFWKIFCYTKGIGNTHVNLDILTNFIPRLYEFENYKMISYFLFLNEKFLIALVFFLISFWLSKNIQLLNFVVINAILYTLVLFFMFLSTPLDLYFQLNSTAARVIKTLSFLLAFFGLYNLTLSRLKGL